MHRPDRLKIRSRSNEGREPESQPELSPAWVNVEATLEKTQAPSAEPCWYRESAVLTGDWASNINRIDVHAVQHISCRRNEA